MASSLPHHSTFCSGLGVFVCCRHMSVYIICLLAGLPFRVPNLKMRVLKRIHAKNVLLIEIISCNIICAQQLFIFNILHITLDIALRNRRVAKVEIVEHRMMCTVITPSLIHFFEM